MARRKTVDLLPQQFIDWLSARLHANGFSDYEGVTDELNETLEPLGLRVSKSAVGRWGKDRQEQFQGMLQKVKESTEMARAMAEVCDDNEAAMSSALVKMSQQKIFDILLLEENPEKAPKLARAIADLARTSIPLAKHQEAVRQRVKAVAEEITESARAQGMDEDQVRFWREKVLGIA